ncbi:MAG: DUF177 domain-containing protein [Bacteroidota bacterium]
MQINISNLAQGIHTYSLEVAPADLEIQQHFTSVIKAEVTLDKSVHQILLEVWIPGVEGHFLCDRCVEEFSRIITCSYRKVYVSREIDGVAFNGDEIEIISPDMNIIDLSNDVRDEILLAIPLKLLCREDCAGLCSRCGKNLNTGQCDCAPAPTDSRWEALARLRDN